MTQPAEHQRTTDRHGWWFTPRGQMTSIFCSGCCAECLVSPWEETLLLLKTKKPPPAPQNPADPPASNWRQVTLKQGQRDWKNKIASCWNSSWSNWDQSEEQKTVLRSIKCIYQIWLAEEIGLSVAPCWRLCVNAHFRQNGHNKVTTVKHAFFFLLIWAI